MDIKKISLLLVKFLSFFAISCKEVVVQSDIFYCIQQGDIKAVKAWVKSKPDISVINQEGRSVLIAAVLTRNHKIVQEILDSEVNVNLRDYYGKTALDYAVDHGCRKMIMPLIWANAKVTTAANELWVKQIVSNNEDYWLFYCGFRLIRLAIVLYVAFFLCVGISAVFELAGSRPHDWPIWFAYAVPLTVHISVLLLMGWSLLSAVILGWLWIWGIIENEGFSMLFLVFVVPYIVILLIGIGYVQGYAVSCWRDKSRVYLLAKE